MKKQPLTERQKEVYNYICIYFMNNKLPPTVEELRSEFEFSSPNSVTWQLKSLEKKGWLVRSVRQARYIPYSISIRCRLAQDNNKKALHD